MVDEERLERFMTKVPVIQMQINGLVMQINGLVSIRQEPPSRKKLMLCYLHVFIEIYPLILTK